MSTKLERDIAEIKKLLRDYLIIKLSNMASEEEAAKILGYSKLTIQKKVYLKEIPTDWYTVNAVGKRFYFKDKIYGLTV